MLNLRTVAVLALVGWVGASPILKPDLDDLTMDELYNLIMGDHIQSPDVNTDPEHTRMVLHSLVDRFDNYKSSATKNMSLRYDRNFIDMLVDMDRLDADRCDSKFFCNTKYLTEKVLITSPPLYAYGQDAREKQIDFCEKNSDFRSSQLSDECF